MYPDPLNVTGAYKGPENCGGFTAAKVISTSYAYNEADLTPAYEIRQCNEVGTFNVPFSKQNSHKHVQYLKLGLLGTSFFYSSGKAPEPSC